VSPDADMTSMFDEREEEEEESRSLLMKARAMQRAPERRESAFTGALGSGRRKVTSGWPKNL
jgi:hypothetical protein